MTSWRILTGQKTKNNFISGGLRPWYALDSFCSYHYCSGCCSSGRRSAPDGNTPRTYTRLV